MRLGAIEQRVADGEEAFLGRWLAQRLSGRPLGAEPFLTYLEAKLERLLG